MADNIVVTIPVELTRAMIISAGVITDEARALELATELHDVVAEVMKLYRARKRRLVEYSDPECEPTEPVVLEEARYPNALEIADFTLAVWRQALGRPGQDEAEAEWISVELAALVDDDLYLRWLMLGDVITGSDVATLLIGAHT
jgi:hypothetical protein